MTEQQRARAMERLDKLNGMIADTEYYIECAEQGDEGLGEIEDLKWSLGELNRDRHRLLQRFPEVRYWPATLVTQE